MTAALKWSEHSWCWLLPACFSDWLRLSIDVSFFLTLVSFPKSVLFLRVSPASLEQPAARVHRVSTAASQTALEAARLNSGRNQNHDYFGQRRDHDHLIRLLHDFGNIVHFFNLPQKNPLHTQVQGDRQRHKSDHAFSAYKVKSSSILNKTKKKKEKRKRHLGNRDCDIQSGAGGRGFTREVVSTGCLIVGMMGGLFVGFILNGCERALSDLGDLCYNLTSCGE